MNFTRQAVNQGRINQRAGEETPGSFGTINNADEFNASVDLAKSPQRLAGQMGARALDMLNNPQEIQRTQTWMQQFGMSNQGMEFNQAKMMMGQQPQ